MSTLTKRIEALEEVVAGLIANSKGSQGEIVTAITVTKDSKPDLPAGATVWVRDTDQQCEGRNSPQKTWIERTYLGCDPSCNYPFFVLDPGDLGTNTPFGMLREPESGRTWITACDE